VNRPLSGRLRRLFALCASLAAFAGLAGGASAQQACNGHVDLCSRPFSETALAGTHNSMAADDYGWNFAITTQTHGLRRQLDRGIRALSLDIHYAAPGFLGGVYNADGPTRGSIEPYLCHQVCVLGSLKATIGFNAIAGFLRDNPYEVVAVYIEDYISPEDLGRALQASDLWRYVNDGPLTRTLGEMIASGKRAVFISQNRRSGYAWYPKLTDIGRDTDYDFKTTDQLTDPANHWNSCRPTPWGAAGRGRILVMQHFVTPTTTGSRSASTVVNQRDVIVPRALRCRDRHGVMPSIVLVDYYELGDVVGAVRALNDRYVPPPPGSSQCTDLSSCGADPERVDPGSGAAGRGPGAAGQAAQVSRVGMAFVSRRSVARGRTIQMRVSVRNSGAVAAVVPVRLMASRPAAVSLPATVGIRVGAGATGSRVVTIRVRPGASPGRVTVYASVAGAERSLAFAITNSGARTAVTG
jgi:hypothetical protein